MRSVIVISMTVPGADGEKTLAIQDDFDFADKEGFAAAIANTTLAVSIAREKWLSGTHPGQLPEETA